MCHSTFGLVSSLTRNRTSARAGLGLRPEGNRLVKERESSRAIIYTLKV